MSCTNEYWEFDYRTTFDSCGGNKHNYIPDIQGDFFNWASPENVSGLAPPKFA